jgi:tyrosyl-tRNA synthetase
MRAKKDLAKRIIADFHSPAEAEAAEENWARQFQKDEVPENLEEVEIAASEVGTLIDGILRVDKVMVRAGLADSNGDAQRKIKAGSVKIDGETYKDLNFVLQTALPAEKIFRVGRKMKKVHLK